MTETVTKSRARPKVKSAQAETELDKAEKQIQAFEDNVKELTLDRMNTAPVKEVESQTKMSASDIAKSKDIWLKPDRSISARDKFNDRLKEKYQFSKQYVQFIAENREIIGETIEIWTRPFGGMPAEFWKVPVNKPVWGPRYLAEQIRRCTYHRLVMQQAPTNADGYGQYYGHMVADTTIHRLIAEPVISKKSVFVEAANF